MSSLEQYQMLVAVAEEASLRQAAKKLFKTQPAVTNGIKKLETELGVLLFDRAGYRLKPTLEGERIVKAAKQLLLKQREIKELAGQLSLGHEPYIKIAIEASFDLNNVTTQLEHIQTHFRSTQITIQQEYLSGALEKLLNNQVDLAISPYNSALFPVGEVESKHIMTGEFVCVVSPKFLSKFGTLDSILELTDEYQIVIQDSGSITDCKEFSVQQGQRVWYVNNFETKKFLIRNSLGWGTLPRIFVEDLISSGELVVLTLTDLPAVEGVEYKVLKLKRKPLGPVSEKIWQLF